MTVADEASPGITVAGRTFRPVTTFPYPQYEWVMALVRSLNLDGVEDRRELMWRIASSEKADALLAGLMVEDILGQVQEWTVGRAKNWATHFSKVTDPDECAVLSAILWGAVPGFFPGAADSSPSSVPTSASSSTTPPSISEAPKNEPASVMCSVSSDSPPAE